MAVVSASECAVSQVAPTGSSGQPGSSSLALTTGCLSERIEIDPSSVGQPEGSHCVYVVRLQPEVLNQKKFTKANPNRSPSGLCLYFEPHLNGLRTTRLATRRRSGPETTGLRSFRASLHR